MGLPRPGGYPPVGTVFTGRLHINASGGGAQGWSEKYYLQANGYAQAVAALTAIWDARRHMLARDCTLVYAYVTDDAIIGDSKLLDISGASALGDFGGVDVLTTHAWNTLLIRIEAGALYHTLRHIRGIPNNENLHNYSCSDAYLALVNDFGDALIAWTKIFIKLHPQDPFPGFGRYRIPTTIATLRFSERRDGRPFGLRRGQSRRRATL